MLTYCFENNITLCRLPSHTSHKLQPCDVGVFEPLKTAYREQVEALYRGGANAIGKQHFTLSYKRAHEMAMTTRNIRSAWSRAGLYPINPEKVLAGMAKPVVVEQNASTDDTRTEYPDIHGDELRTPTTSSGWRMLQREVAESISTLDGKTKLYFQKMTNASEKSYAENALHRDQIRLLLEQNNEKKIRQSIKSTVVGHAKVMSYEDIVEARKKRDEKEVAKADRAAKTLKRKAAAGTATGAKRLWIEDAENIKHIEDIEAENAEHEIAGTGLSS